MEERKMIGKRDRFGWGVAFGELWRVEGGDDGSEREVEVDSGGGCIWGDVNN